MTYQSRMNRQPPHVESEYCISSNGYMSLIYNKNLRDIYVGELINGRKYGLGTMYYDNGIVHICKWKNDKADGYGICKYPDGSEYIGKWKNNIFHGRRNEIYYPNGDYYRGEVHSNNIRGTGKMIYRDGTVYIGEFQNGMRHGNGMIIDINKDEYHGKFYMNNLVENR